MEGSERPRKAEKNHRKLVMYLNDRSESYCHTHDHAVEPQRQMQRETRGRGSVLAAEAVGNERQRQCLSCDGSGKREAKAVSAAMAVENASQRPCLTAERPSNPPARPRSEGSRTFQRTGCLCSPDAKRFEEIPRPELRVSTSAHAQTMHVLSQPLAALLALCPPG